MKTKKYTALILAAGQGSRMQLSYNKILHELDGKPIIWHTIQPFLADLACEEIILVISSNDLDYFEKNFSQYKLVIGSDTRQKSAYAGLKHVKSEYVMIHDGARCYTKKQYLNDLMLKMQDFQAALLMVPCTDTIKVVENGVIKETLNRNSLYQAQTPQCFKTEVIINAHKLAHTVTCEIYDDAMLVELFTDFKVAVVLSDYTNKKITTKADIA